MARRASVGSAAIVGFLVGIAVATWWARRSAITPASDAVSPTSNPTPAQDAHRPSAAVPGEHVPTRPVSERSVAATAPPAEAPSRPRSTLVYGRLLEVDGTPWRAKWAWVSMTNDAGRRWKAEAVGGAYAIADLPLGDYFLSAQAMSHRDADDRLEVTASAPELRKDLTLRRATVLPVFVRTPEGEPFFESLRKIPGTGDVISNLVPVATVDPPGAHVYEVTGSLNNPFGVGQFWQQSPDGEDPPAGCIGYLTLARDPPVSVSLVFCHAVLRTTQAGPGTEDVSFVLSLDEVRAAQSSFRVQVVDAVTSSPLQAYVQLNGGTRGFGSLQTDASGVLSVDPELPGRFDLRVAKEGYEEVRQVVDLEPGQPTDLGVVSLAREVIAEIHFVDGLGRPAQVGVFFAPLTHGNGIVDVEHARGLRSDPTGLVNVHGLGRKVYALWTSNYDAAYVNPMPDTTWVAGNVTLDATSGSIPPMTIRLQQAVPLAIRVEGRKADGLRFTVVDGQGRSVLRDRFWGNAPRPLRLPAGSYRVQLRDGADAVLTERPVVLATEPVELSLAP